jgi:murein DD-endopeptidase MepM/ murein hydrolase activator NlpD
VRSSQEPAGRYRGRRRLPKLPSKRYAGVVTTASLAAAAVALAAGTVLPEPAGAGGNADDPTRQALAVSDRLNALDKASRSQFRPGTAGTADQGAPDLWLLPVRASFQITTLYEMRWGEFHWGVDMAAPYGTPYYAAHAGVVTVAGYEGGYGLAIRIDHGNGIETVYGHSSQISVKVGDRVQAGERIGLIGSTGYSTGNHLHFEVNVRGEHVDPMQYLLARGVDIAKRLEAANGGEVIT